MYQELELWNAEQLKIRKNWLFKSHLQNKPNYVADHLQPAKEAKPDKDELLSAALAECFAMGV